MRTFIPVALTGLVATPAAAANINLTVEIPQLPVAEYHRPYVAAWLENTGQPTVTNLAVWYDLHKRGGEGQKWLRDLRTWWRKSGRTQSLPIDGVTGATRAPGPQRLGFTPGKAPLQKLAPGNYELVVEAAREVGGREVVRIPFQWPPKAAQSLSANGKAELGRVAIDLKP